MGLKKMNRIMMMVLLVVLFLCSGFVDAAWLSGWGYRRLVNVSENSGTALSDYQVLIPVVYDSDMKADFSDLRFTDSDGSTLLSYWIEDYTPSTSASVWVQVLSIPAGGMKTIYMYYGNPAVGSVDDVDATFFFHDDFSSDAKWTSSDLTYLYVAGGVLSVNIGSTEYIYVTDFSEINDFAMKFDIMITDGTLMDVHVIAVQDDTEMFFHSTNLSGVAFKEAWSGTAYEIDSYRKTDGSSSTIGSIGTFLDPNVWYGIKVFKYQGTTELELWDNTFSSMLGSGSEGGSPTGGLDELVASQFNGGITGEIDNLFVRKYVSPEPSVVFSGEALLCAKCPDIDGDGRVWVSDNLILAQANGTCFGDVNYNEAADLNGDGCVDEDDNACLSMYYGDNSSEIPICNLGPVEAVVRVFPVSQTVSAGGNFSVDILVEDVAYLDGGQAALNFDPAVVNAVEIIEGDFLESGGSTWGVEKINNSEGIAIFAYSLIGNITYVNGSGVLATVKLNVSKDAEGTFDLTLTDVKLIDVNSAHILPIEVDNGSFTVLSSGALGNVSGRVLFASNSSGVGGALVSLLNSSVVFSSVFTGVVGNYSFVGVPFGNYSVNASKGVFWHRPFFDVNLSSSVWFVGDILLWLKGDLNNNGRSADVGDLGLMKRACLSEVAADWRYDLNGNLNNSDPGDLVLMKDASVGTIMLT